MFTIALLGWTMACLVDFERGRTGVGRLATLIPLYIVWTNLHGGVLGGTMTLGLAVTGWIATWLLFSREPSLRDEHEGDPPSLRSLDSRLNGPVTNRRTAMLLIAITVACLLTPLVNPFGMEMIRTWQKDRKSTRLNSSHRT